MNTASSQAIGSKAFHLSPDSRPKIYLADGSRGASTILRLHARQREPQTRTANAQARY
jgi:hypothetical protein